MSSLRELQQSLASRMEEVKQRDALIQHLEREIQSRDRQIRGMQAELDKFKQILKPMTQQLAQNLTIQVIIELPPGTTSPFKKQTNPKQFLHEEKCIFPQIWLLFYICPFPKFIHLSDENFSPTLRQPQL